MGNCVSIQKDINYNIIPNKPVFNEDKNISQNVRAIQSLISSGYIRQIEKELNKSLSFSYGSIPCDLITLCSLFIGNCLNTVIWNIDGQKYQKLLQSQNGECVSSDTFYFAKLPWKIAIFSNGSTIKQSGSCRIFVRLLKKPKHWNDVMVQVNIQCEKVYLYFHVIHSYNDECMDWCLNHHHLYLSQLKKSNLTSIEIQIKLKIIRVTLKENIKNKVCFHHTIPIKSSYKLNWKIHRDLINVFKNSLCHKVFYQSNVEQDQMFIMACYPKGYNVKRNEEFVSLYLFLIDLPSGKVEKIRVNCTLSCKQIGKTWSFNYIFSKNNSWGKSRFCLLKDVKKVKTVTFSADVEIMGMYDLDGTEIPRYAWHEDDKVYDYNQCF